MENFDVEAFEAAWNAPLTARPARTVYEETPGFLEAWNAPLTLQPGPDPECVYCQHGSYTCEHMAVTA